MSFGRLGASFGRTLLNGVGRAAVGPLRLNDRLVSEGDSITAGTNGPMWSQFSMIAENGAFFRPFDWNDGVGGTTTAQMIARQANVTSLRRRIFTFLGGTNDLTGTADTPAVIAARIQQYAQNCFANGSDFGVICKVTPRNDATFLALSPARQADRLLLNQIIGTLAIPGKLAIVDLESTFNPTTMTGEGLHPNYFGAEVLGFGFAGAINSFAAPGLDILPLFNQPDNMLFAGAQNPQLAGTAGGLAPTTLITGQVADRWTVATNDTTMTAACSKVLAPDGVTAAQRIVVSGTNSTAGKVVNFTRTVAYNGLIGQQYEAWAGFSLAAGCQNLRSIFVSCDTGQSMNNTVSTNMSGDALAGVLRAPPNVPLVVNDSSMNFQFVLAFNAGPVAADVTVFKPAVRQVPAGQ